MQVHDCKVLVTNKAPEGWIPGGHPCRRISVVVRRGALSPSLLSAYGGVGAAAPTLLPRRA
eukprot:11318082-Alexandrium_andersonii.AAC.1